MRQDRSSVHQRPARTFDRVSSKGKTHEAGSTAAAPSSLRDKTDTGRKRLLSGKDFGRAPPKREFYVWGRRTVEAYLSDLQTSENIEATSLTLHLIGDKAGKVPAQLKPSVDNAKSLGIKIQLHTSQEDETWPLDSDEPLNHQRVCLRVPSIPTKSVFDAVARVKDASSANLRGCVGIVLDQIQDPRNFGAILRSAAFFGVKFVAFAQDRQADLSPLVLKTSAGGAFSVDLVPVVNVSRTLTQLKDAGAWIVGTALKESQPLSAVPIDRPYIVVLGNEAKGLRPEVARQCDYLARIPGGALTVDSLNVSVAAGVVLSHFAPDAQQAHEPDLDTADTPDLTEE